MVSKKTVKRVAETARLRLSEAELNKMSKDISTVLRAFGELEGLAVGKEVRPSFQPIESRNVMRKDCIKSGLTQKQALANTKQKERGYFRGPKAV